MFDVGSIFGYDVASVPVSDLAWGGWLSDVLLSIFPAGAVGQAPVFLAIIIAFILIAQKNSMEMMGQEIGQWRLVFSIVICLVAVCFMLAATSSVFLYFNF